MHHLEIVPPPTHAVGGRPPDRQARPDEPGEPADGGADDDRPPLCPVCRKRLVILAMHPGRAADGRSIRRQLWGCPRGHATAYRTEGVFGPYDLLDDLEDE